MIFQSNSYFNERHYIGRNLWVGCLFILLFFLIILLEFVLFIYVCSFVRVFIGIFYCFFWKIQINITNKKKKRKKHFVIMNQKSRQKATSFVECDFYKLLKMQILGLIVEIIPIIAILSPFMMTLVKYPILKSLKVYLTMKYIMIFEKKSSWKKKLKINIMVWFWHLIHLIQHMKVENIPGKVRRRFIWYQWNLCLHINKQKIFFWDWAKDSECSKI